MEGVDYFADVEPSELVPYLKIRDFISSLEQMVIKEVPSQAPHGLYEISNLIKDLGISPAIKVVDNLEDIFGEGGHLGEERHHLMLINQRK